MSSSMYVGSIAPNNLKRNISNIYKGFELFQALYAKMPQYSCYTHCLKEELAHFGLTVSTYFGLDILGRF